MTETFQGGRYSIVAWANDQETLYYHEFGSYQGEWLLASFDDENYFIWKGGYGSCSGCDHYESEVGYDPPTKEKAKEFAEDYQPFLEVPRDTMINIVRGGKMLDIMPANIRDEYSEVDIEEASIDISVTIAVREGLQVTAKDVMSVSNAELQQQALAYLTYDKFLVDVQPETIDQSGEDSLLKHENMVFLSLKDSSTDRRYFLRVPPDESTVKGAVAWTFGMNESQYDPIIET
jgi:hypothetical protein